VIDLRRLVGLLCYVPRLSVIYGIARRTSNVTNNAAAHTLITASSDRAYIQEMGVFMAAATASVFGVGRPAANGVTPTSPVTLEAEDPALPAGTVQSAIAFTTSPTNPTNFLRRWAAPATIGTGVIWTFPRALVIPVSAQLVLQNQGTNGVVDTYVSVDE
jgi:hypothetical protein